jgi:hypothetical protein
VGEGSHLPPGVGVVEPGGLPGRARADHAVPAGEQRAEVERYLPARGLGELGDGLHVPDGPERCPGDALGGRRRGSLLLSGHEVVRDGEEAQVDGLDVELTGIGPGPQGREVARGARGRLGCDRVGGHPGERPVGQRADPLGLGEGRLPLSPEEEGRHPEFGGRGRVLDDAEGQDRQHLLLRAAPGDVQQGEGADGVLRALGAGRLGGPCLGGGGGQHDDADQGQQHQRSQIPPQRRPAPSAVARSPEDPHGCVSADPRTS